VELADGTFIPAELILLSVGVRAEIDLAKRAGLEIGVTGGVKVNARMESSDPDIYAVGDGAETTHYSQVRAHAFPWPDRPTARAALQEPMRRAGTSSILARWEPQLSVSCT
jgi:NADPH-dependent 2,4-dienoyl-CoA reductase/sulfur reductase-like enzyme